MKYDTETMRPKVRKMRATSSDRQRSRSAKLSTIDRKAARKRKQAWR